MMGQVRRLKANVPPDLIRDRLNAKMRDVVNRRPYWIGLLEQVVIPIPAAYKTGQVTVETGSNIVTGIGTAWPVFDVVNTTIPEGVPMPGVQFVTPASMGNINDNCLLYIDADGVTPEIVPVRRVNNEQFQAKFRFPHNLDCKVQMSSQVNRQFRLTPQAPIYSVLAVTSPTSLVLDNVWGNAGLTGSGYEIVTMYIHIASDCKYVERGFNYEWGREMNVQMTKPQLDFMDPYRQNINQPSGLAWNMKNACNNMTWELWPRPTTQCQIGIAYYREWPDMEFDTDLPLPFLNPTVLVDGVLAEFLLAKMSDDDTNINPQLAAKFEASYERGVMDAMKADSDKAEQEFTWLPPNGGGMGANFWMKNDPDLLYGNGDW